MSKLEVRETKGRGRGVYALEPIEEGESIERCHVIVIPEEQLQNVANTILHEYFFRWGGTQDDGAVALGNGSLYNHSDTPNAMYVRKVGEGILEFVALRAIASGEEIFVSYHGGFGERGPLWFDQR